MLTEQWHNRVSNLGTKYTYRIDDMMTGLQNMYTLGGECIRW